MASADRMMSDGEEEQAVEDLVAHGFAEGVPGDGDDAIHARPLAAAPAASAHEEILERLAARGDREDARHAARQRGASRKASTSAPSGSSTSMPSGVCRTVPPRAGAGSWPTSVAQAHLGGEQARRSAARTSGPTLRMRPAKIMATRSQVISTSGRMCVEKKHGVALALELEHEVADLLAADGVEPGHGLVEDDQLGIAHQGLRDADALEHALGELAQRAGRARGRGRRA